MEKSNTVTPRLVNKKFNAGQLVMLEKKYDLYCCRNLA